MKQGTVRTRFTLEVVRHGWDSGEFDGEVTSVGDGPRYERSDQIPLLVTEFVSAHPTMMSQVVIFDDGQ
ncbi:hypothetical protein C3492_14160 [Streptomyces sp. Ru62]|nr:hypothetical protein C3492_14160 [Streptomyces sp. Ru62]